MKKEFFLLISLFCILGCSLKNRKENRPDLNIYFDEYEVKGCFVLFDFQENKTVIYNQERCREGFLPASTFKIVNTLIGLESGIITGEEFIIPWDSVTRQVPIWNKEHKLFSAFKNSIVPWYQELARQIGAEQMQYWVKQSNFGKMEITSEDIDLFWLTGKSRITPFEQLDFQKKLIHNDLPFQQKHIDLLKKFMILKETPEYIFRGKTGWAVMDNKNIGWLVGYLEKDKNRYAYVLNVESEDEDSTLFKKSRIEVVRKIFKQLSLM